MLKYIYMKNLSKNKTIIIIAIVLTLVFVLSFIFFKNNIQKITKISINNQNLNGNNYIFHINNIDIKKGYNIIDGYIYKNNEKIETSTIKLILEDINTKQAYLIPTYVYYKEDLVDDNNNYGWSGFTSYIDNNIFNIDTNDYNIYLYTVFNDEEVIVTTNIKTSELIKYEK